ncbi:MAG TPA: polysaccharide biosynthesis/export family protein, partial [Kamptonema sp.]|nr:polysaccharide biosynthesis/export family protein [Kamptonema sp.]
MIKNYRFFSRLNSPQTTNQAVKSLSLSMLLTMSSVLPSLAQLPTIRGQQQNPRRTAPLPPPPPPGTLGIPSNSLGSMSQEAAYTLGAGDRISLDIFGVPEFSKEYQILVDGTLNLPLIRSVSVQGLTQQQAADAIAKLYDPYITAPIVTLTLIIPRPLNIGIAGEVSRPGSYKVNPSREGQGVKFPTLIEMLQLAKGVTPGGDLRGIQVRRRQRSGAEQIINVNLQEFLQT